MSGQSFRDGLSYPVLFMVLLSLIFVGILAAMYRLSEPKIERQQREQYERAILGLCAEEIASVAGTTAPQIVNAYPGTFAKYISPLPDGTFPRKAFQVKYNDQTLSFVFDVAGKGLWGTMRALVATTPAADTILAFTVYEQMETPGLGARISESWFVDQFRRKALIVSGAAVKFELIPEKQAAASSRQINQVTGATITTNAVVSMLRNELSLIYKSRQQQGDQ